MMCMRALRRSLVALVVLTIAPFAVAGSDPATVSASTAPAGTDTRIKRALSTAVSRHVTELRLGQRLRSYSIVPALIKLQEVYDADEQPGLVCVVALSLQDSERGIVANLQASAMSFGVTRLEVVDAAARAAVHRLPETLVALKKQEQRPIAVPVPRH